MYTIGLMSGTSADGVDAAIVRFTDRGADQPPDYTLIAYETYPYESELRTAILRAFRPESATPQALAALNTELGFAFASAVQAMCQSVGLAPSQIAAVGSHGQTIWYQPPTADRIGDLLTLGEPAIIAHMTGIKTISHFRESDIAAGGRGAPLVGLLDWWYFRHPTIGRVIQNIGGIGNVTHLPPLDSSEPAISFDTGPGNMLIDAVIAHFTNHQHQFDPDGQFAARGTVDTELLAWLMRHPYLSQPPPKTTGRELFGVQFAAEVIDHAATLHPDSIIATVTAFTAYSIAQSYRDFLPSSVHEVYIAGGGAKNPVLLDMLSEALPNGVRVLQHDDLGLPGAAKEAVLFALLAFLTLHNRPGALPMFTGASRPMVLGRVTG